MRNIIHDKNKRHRTKRLYFGNGGLSIMKKKMVSFMLVAAMGAAMLAGCGNSAKSGDEEGTQQEALSVQAPETSAPEETAEPEAVADQLGQTEITVFAAASLSGVLDELIGIYN